MSFFFSQNKTARKAPRAPTGAPAQKGLKAPTVIHKRNSEALHRAGCTACPLNKAPNVYSPYMKPSLAQRTQVYFLGEAPDQYEDQDSGRPLTGPVGRLLRGLIPQDQTYVCSFDNMLNCRPPKNREPAWQEIECCRPRRWKYVEQVKPKLVIGLGAAPLHAIMGTLDLKGMRGRVFAVKIGTHVCWFMPTYHPALILKKAFNKKKPLRSKFGHCLKMDIKRAFKIINKLGPPRVDDEAAVRSNIQCFDGSQREDLENLLTLLQSATEAPLKAIDLETKGLRPFSRGAAVMTAAISYGTCNFSFAVDHPQAKWKLDQKAKILKAFGRLVRDPASIKVAHNLPFELEWLMWLFNDLTIADHAAWECTQMQAHFLDERKGERVTYQALDFLIKQHFGVAYKSLFKLDKKDMSRSPLRETLIYNGVDTKYTLALFIIQDKLLQQLNFHNSYFDALPRQITVAVMQTLGMSVNQDTRKRFQSSLKEDIEGDPKNGVLGILQEINDLKVVQAFKAKEGRFDPLSPDQCVKLFRDYLSYGNIVLVAPDEGRSSVDKVVLDQIDHPLAKLLLRLRNKNKLKSTYVDILEPDVDGSVLYPDGLIHCNFNCTFTETGRLSSHFPNMQNYPSRADGWVREQIEGGEGNVLLAFDYGQLEACTAAMCSKDKVLVKSLWEDYDIHLEWTHKLIDAYPLILGGNQSKDDPKILNKLRSVVKNKLVFPAFFGAADKSIANYLKIPVEPVTELMNEFWKSFSGYKRWQDAQMDYYYEEGIVTSFTGRARHYPLTRNQVVNHPVQCLAAEIVCSSMNRLSYKAIQEKTWCLHPRLNIHDDLTFVIPDNDAVIEQSVRIISKIMLNPPYKCLNVPLSVKASVGTNWGVFDERRNINGMVEIGKFWSHK